MILPEKTQFITDSEKALSDMYNKIMRLDELFFLELQPNSTALIIVDMVNGFAKGGALYSPRIKRLINPIVKLAKRCNESSVEVLAFADCHTKGAPELDSYPAHCMNGTWEAEIVDEIKDNIKYTLFNKNCTNVLFQYDFAKWLTDNEHINTYIIVGDCTDICINQLAVGIKAMYNNCNKRCRVIVPVEMVDTYDSDIHPADIMNMTSFLSMQGNGIEVVSDII